MPHPPLPLDGTCRCGRVRVRMTAAPVMTMACHCRGCQRMSASAYSLSAAVPAHALVVVEGAPVPGGRSAEAGHFFCAACMTWMFTRPPGLEDFVNVRPSMFEDVSWFSPYIETFTSARLSFAQTGAVHSYPGFPPPEAFVDLMAGFAALHGTAA